MKKWSHLESTKSDWELKILDKERRQVFLFIFWYFILTISVVLASFVVASMIYLPSDVSDNSQKTADVVTTTPPVREMKIATITHYTSSPEETDASPCISADGNDICKLFKQGKNTCGTNDYPFGTELYVADHGFCTVHDVMNARFTGKGYIDWYMGQDKKAAFEHGIETKEIVIFRK